MTNGTEHLTTTEIQQIIQKERDTSKNKGRFVSLISIDYGAADPLVADPDDLEFFKGRFVIARFSDGTEYIPVENILSIGFKYDNEQEE